MTEQNFTFETREIPDQELIDLLKERGAEDPEVRRLLIDWTIKKETAIEKSEDYCLGQINLNIERGHLYLAAGYIDEAIESLDDAATQAWNEYRDELYQKIIEEIKQIESQLDKQDK